jgi:hypothetical protein
MVQILAVAVLVASAYSQSISNCGGSSDHLQNVVMKVTPDPPVKGQPLTLSFSGTLDEDFTGGSVEVDLQIKALNIIDKAVKTSAPFSFTPGLPKGPQSITVGPFSLPSNVPGSAVIKGTVKLVNAKNEPVSCSTLNLDLPAMEETPAPTTADVGGVSCGQPSDHLKNVDISSDGGVLKVSGSLDEAITKASVNVDLKIHEVFSIPIKLTIPFTLSPGIPKGDFKLTAGPSTPARFLARALVHQRQGTWNLLHWAFL